MSRGSEKITFVLMVVFGCYLPNCTTTASSISRRNALRRRVRARMPRQLVWDDEALSIYAGLVIDIVGVLVFV